MTVHVCRPATVTFRRVRHCPTCERPRRMVAVVAVWYGSLVTCCTCGDTWGDGHRLPRPFARGWRARESAEARRRWAAAPSRADADETLRNLLDQAVGS